MKITKSKGLKPKKKARVHKIPKFKKRFETNKEKHVRYSEDLLEMCDPTQEDFVKKGVFTDEPPF